MTAHATHVAKRWLYLVHRWLGIAACLLFLAWFVSGVVMMYVPYPSLTAAERLDGLRPIDWSRVRVGPAEALRRAALDRYPGELRLEMQRGIPVWRVRPQDGTRRALSAIDGGVIRAVDSAHAAAIAREFAGGAPVTGIERIERDQWTVAQGFDWARPLFKLSLGDTAGTQIYVASTTGEVVQNSTRAERAWNWLGAVTHWLYPTLLRRNGPAWRQVVMWTSGPATIVGITGLWIGILRLRVRRRYRSGAISPYRSGWLKWHHLIGLVGGLTTITWMASGWLSVNPFGWFERGTTAGAPVRYAGHDAPDFPAIDGHALEIALPAARIARFAFAGGVPVATLTGSAGATQAFTPAGKPLAFTLAQLEHKAGAIVPGAAIASRAMVREPDLYWYARAPNPFRPALRLRFDDRASTWAYLDPTTGELLAIQTASGRTYRWLFAALHDFDLPLLLAHRAIRDPLMWLLSLLGGFASLSGIVIGWRRLRRKVAPRTSITGENRSDLPTAPTVR